MTVSEKWDTREEGPRERRVETQQCNVSYDACLGTECTSINLVVCMCVCMYVCACLSTQVMVRGKCLVTLNISLFIYVCERQCVCVCVRVCAQVCACHSTHITVRRNIWEFWYIFIYLCVCKVCTCQSTLIKRGKCLRALIHVYLFTCVCVCACVHAIAHVWQSEESIWKPFLSFHSELELRAFGLRLMTSAWVCF